MLRARTSVVRRVGQGQSCRLCWLERHLGCQGCPCQCGPACPPWAPCHPPAVCLAPWACPLQASDPRQVRLLPMLSDPQRSFRQNFLRIPTRYGKPRLAAPRALERRLTHVRRGSQYHIKKKLGMRHLQLFRHYNKPGLVSPRARKAFLSCACLISVCNTAAFPYHPLRCLACNPVSSCDDQKSDHLGCLTPKVIIGAACSSLAQCSLCHSVVILAGNISA